MGRIINPTTTTFAASLAADTALSVHAIVREADRIDHVIDTDCGHIATTGHLPAINPPLPLYRQPVSKVRIAVKCWLAGTVVVWIIMCAMAIMAYTGPDHAHSSANPIWPILGVSLAAISLAVPFGCIPGFPLFIVLAARENRARAQGLAWRAFSGY